MSVLRTVEAVPSRIEGVFRYMLERTSRSERRTRLEYALAPSQLVTRAGETSNMVSSVINECKKMGLLEERDENGEKAVAVPQHILTLYGRKSFDNIAFRRLLLRLIADPANDENHDLCRAISWLLAQDPFRFQGNQTGIMQTLYEQIGDQRLGMTNASQIDDLRYWSVYLGFAWTHKPLRSEGAWRLVPDATAALGLLLGDLFSTLGSGPVPIDTLLQSLWQICPIFPGGQFYRAIAEHVVQPSAEYVIPALGLAWLRLRDQKRIELVTMSDAASRVLLDGSDRVLCTHVSLIPEQGDRVIAS